MHIKVARAWEGLANDLPNDGEHTVEAARLYRAALDEYKKAVDLDPANAVALNNYAYVFWEWVLKTWKQHSTIGPDASEARRAEEFARQATLLSKDRGSTDRAIYNSTLLEVLLGEARPKEAI